MHLTVEVTGRFDHAGDASKLLYAPLTQHLTFRESRRYLVEFEGDAAALQAFLQKVLANETSHELHQGEQAAVAGWSFLLDYGMKAGALDLEKETIMAYYRGLENAGFTLKQLKIQRRIYLFGAATDQIASLSDRFVKDIVNPAIHHHKVEAA
jgi:hypothetical protein